mmetsp:Transcript_113921/g.322524  ORF Transcript_113921/g.322524 Transcript_113921/m.322524 type:complete len:199 (-) Transcript_113921:91-687(-)
MAADTIQGGSAGAGSAAVLEPAAVSSSAPGDVRMGLADEHMRGLLHYLKEEAFIANIAEWSWDWCMDFPSALPTAAEHSHRFTDAHREYRDLFEGRAQEYLRVHGLEVDNFLRLAVEFLSSRADGNEVEEIYEGLVASEDYTNFYKYMGTVRRRREWAERTLCSACDEIDWTQLVRTSLRKDLGDVTVGDDSDVESIE